MQCGLIHRLHTVTVTTEDEHLRTDSEARVLIRGMVLRARWFGLN